MELLKAIEYADKLLPNPYTLEEKIFWCDEVSSEIARNILKKFDIIETTLDKSGEISLPPDISFDMIEQFIIDGSRYTKLDFRSFLPNTNDSLPDTEQKIKIVYLTVPKPTRMTEISGEFNTSENVIEMDSPPFLEGEKIQITPLSSLSDTPNLSNSIYAYVLEVCDDRIILDRDALTAETGAYLNISRVIDDLTYIDSAPYDRMYIEYILSKIALYQHDYPSYNAHMTQYNCLFESARRDFITRSPLSTQIKFKNYSTI